MPVSGEWLGRRRVGDEISLTDARGATRQARIVSVDGVSGRVRAEFWDTTYLETGLRLDCGDDRTSVGPLPRVGQYHLLAPGRPPRHRARRGASSPWHHGQPGMAEITCSLPEFFSSVRVGERILFDDGKLSGVIESVAPDRVVSPHHSRARPRREASVRKGNQSARHGLAHAVHHRG